MPGVTESDIRWILWEAGEVDAVPWLENGFVSQKPPVIASLPVK